MNSNISGPDNSFSIITPVTQPANAVTVFSNYVRQDTEKKELLLVHCGTVEEFECWLGMTRLYPMVRIYRLPAGTPSDTCLKYCAERSIFDNIALFLETETYETSYLSLAFKKMQQTGSAITGETAVQASFPDSTRPIGQEIQISHSCYPLSGLVFRRSSSGNIRFSSSEALLDP